MSTSPDRTPSEPPTPSAPIPIRAVPPVAKRPRRNRRKWIWLACGILVVAAGAEYWRMQAADAIRYDTVAVERGTVQASVTASGTVNAVVDVQVGSQVSGNIKALYADFNTKVTKGQLVAEIDPQVFQTQVDQATAALSSMQAAVLTASAQVQKANSDASGAVANEKSSEAVLAKDRASALNAANQFQRQDALLKRGLLSVSDHDLAQAVTDAAGAQVTADQAQTDAAKQTILSTQASVLVSNDQLASAQALERQSEASLAEAKINLERTRITAPVNGTVIARRMDVGQTVAASLAAPTIFEIAQDLTKMQLDASVDESDIGGIVAGQNATFTVDAYPATTFSGQVLAVRQAPISAQNVVTYDVVISVSNPDLKLLPGMTANARILTAKLDNTIKVPNAVLRNHPTTAALTQFGLPAAQANKPQVYVVRNGKLQALTVSYGLSDGKYTAVTSGDLTSGDQVVVRFTTAADTPTASAPAAPGAAGGRRGPGF